jgi:predicted lipoprotein with Yx(FWY)xxD motif
MKELTLRRLVVLMTLAAALGTTGFLAAGSIASDRSGKSACTSRCAQYWPPLMSQGKPTAGRGVKAALLGQTKRADGSTQVTYNRHPLYTFALDKQAGQVNGEASSNFGAKWYAVSASGGAVVKATTATTPTTTAATTTGGGGYPYP